MSQVKDPYYSEEIRIVDAINQLKSYFFYILRRWWVILIFIVGFCVLGVLYAKFIKEDQYVCMSSFMIDSEGGAGASSSTLSALAGTFGLGSKGGELTNELLHGILKSRRVIKTALLSKVKVEEDSVLLANHYMDTYPGWAEDIFEEGFRFEETDLYNLPVYDDNMLNIMHKRLLEDHVSVVYEESNGLNLVTVSSISRIFSRFLTQHMLDYASSYFIHFKTVKEKVSLEKAVFQSDSIKGVLNGKEARMAAISDGSGYRIKASAYLEEGRLLRDITVLSEMFGQSYASLEAAKLSLKDKTPVIEIVDEPTFATVYKPVKLIMVLILSVILGIFFGVIYLMIKKLIEDSVREELALEN